MSKGIKTSDLLPGDFLYMDSTGVEWVVIEQNVKGSQNRYAFWPRNKGHDCIESDTESSVKRAKELIEHTATADDVERAKWGKGPTQ